MPKKSLPALVLPVLACAALVMSACSTTSYAATVGGTTISQATLVSEVHGYQDSPLISGSAAPTGKAKATVPASVAAGLLNDDVENVLVEQILQSRHATVSKVATQLAQGELESQLSSSGQSAQTTKSEIQPAFEKYLIASAANTIALEASLANIELSPANIRAYYEKHTPSFDQICIEDALYSAQSDAQAAVTSIQGGTSFTTATSNAQQPGSSTPDCGSLAVVPAALQQAILSTPMGQVGPVEPVTGTGSDGSSETGYAVFEVVSKTPQKYTSKQNLDAAEEMLQGVGATVLQDKFTARLKAETKKTRITVNPADGRITYSANDPLGFQVAAPKAPSAKSLPSTTTSTTAAPSAPASPSTTQFTTKPATTKSSTTKSSTKHSSG